MESEPLRQAVEASEGLPPSVEIHDVRGGELNVGPCATVPTTPHMQPQHLRRIQLHLSRKRSREAETTTRWLAQPDEELARVVPDVALHWRRGRWRRRGRSAAPSSSPLSATMAPTSPLPLPLAAGSTATSSWGGAMRCLAETLAANDEASPRPLAMAGEERKQEWGRGRWRKDEGHHSTCSPLYKGVGARLGRPLSANPASRSDSKRGRRLPSPLH